MATLDADVMDLALRSDRILARSSLDGLGVTRRQRQRLLATGVLRPVSPHVYVVGSGSLT